MPKELAAVRGGWYSNHANGQYAESRALLPAPFQGGFQANVEWAQEQLNPKSYHTFADRLLYKVRFWCVLINVTYWFYIL